MKESNTSVIEEKDIIVKTLYTKTKKQLRYNYLIQLENYEVANLLYGQIIVVEGNNLKLENPSDRFEISSKVVNKNNNTITNLESSLANMEVEDKNSNNCHNNYQNNNHQYPVQVNTFSNNTNSNFDLNNILTKLTESNTFLCSTVQNLATNIESLNKEIKTLGLRVDVLECKGKRTRDIIEEDTLM
ncbi:hypothetical protein ABK040_009434 [Willaertia magna]